ncbi:asparagine synthase (glutamine-hydrolyzing) [Streptomyces rubiginosohelvolus]|uniref:asparagine synthase (glutamine-hydrolyzing) n=1 Tax=Streptomyces rubiginosohelvolus TaxID=67362 RepID=UPI0036AD382D
MCGLAGIAAIGRELDATADALIERMGSAVEHRGPDAYRTFREGPVALGFRRLALVGPNSGDQPLFSADEQVVLIANGEVYNHRDLERRLGGGLQLRTASDCEILAHLYARNGLQFLDEANGMYAVALWDRRANRLLLGRDRFGIKPLYYVRVGGTILFASELKALFEHPDCPRDLDWTGALADQSMNIGAYFTHEPITSWFRNIRLVPAGTIVSIDLDTGAAEEHPYWKLPDFTGGLELSDAEFIRTYRELLAESIDAASSADAELGLFLSGGIDSAAVAALSARQGRELHTFTVVNGSTLVNGDAESAYRIAAELGLPHHQVLFDPTAVPTPEQWKDLLWLLETPLCGPEQYFKYELYRYAKQTRPELRGMLLGAGADEYNGGFTTGTALGQNWAGFEAGIRQLGHTSALHHSPALRPWWDLTEGPVLKDGLLPTFPKDPYPDFVAWRHRQLQQYNCWHEDRTAAGNGVESRVPFLDHRIVELLAGIAPERRAGLLWDKRILREAVRDVLPKAVVQRPKGPFFYGEGVGFTHRAFVRMLEAKDGLLLEEALAAPGAKDVLRPDALRSMLGRLHTEAEPWDVEFLLRLVNLGLLDTMVRSLPVAPARTPAYEVRSAVPIEEWERDAPDVTEWSDTAAEPAADQAIGFSGTAELVASVQRPEVLYIAVNGAFEYVVDAADDAGWAAFLQRVDGVRTVGELLEDCSGDLDAVQRNLRVLLNEGVLERMEAA